MRRLLGLAAIMLLIPVLSDAQTAKMKKIIILPFTVPVSQPGLTADYASELSGLLGADLAVEGDVDIIPGSALGQEVAAGRIDPVRMARIASRSQCDAVLWGTLSRSGEELVLEVSAMGKDEREQPHHFATTGSDREELSRRLKDLAAEIGTVVLKRPAIADIKIEGNRRIQKETILSKLSIKLGKPFSRTAVADDIRSLYAMGYFDNVEILADDNPRGGVDLRVVLKERPSVKTIEIEGNKIFTTNQILDALTTKSYTVPSISKIREDIVKLKKMYEKEGYYEPAIDYEIKELSRDETKLVFKIDEGEKSYLTEIDLEGRQRVDEKDFAKIMTIKPKGWFWFLDESGTFTREKLDENRMRIMATYMEHGFVNAQVGEPKIDIQKGKVKVTYPIREGERYQVRKVDVDGENLDIPKEKLIEELKLKPKTWFQRSYLGDDIKNLTRLFNNQGYAYADVEPRQNINDKYGFLDMTYKITKGERVTIERVDIVGNERTRDKVIRRSLAISEGDQYNADALEASKKMLESMEFFDAVRLKTAPGSKPDTMVLTVEVAEKKTGSLAAGLGYSSQDGAMGNINLKEMNLFGMGVVANAKANLSGRRNSYEGSLAYPWMFDIPLTGRIQGYKAISKEERYVRDGEGFSVSLSYPLWWGWSVSTGFSRDSSKFGGFDQGFAKSIMDYYRRFGSNPTRFMNQSENAVSLTFGLDTRNSSMIPTAGSKISFGGRFAGLGGDVAYNRYFTEAMYYRSFFWRTVGKVRLNASALQEAASLPIPFDRRIMLGGISSIRGFNYGEVGPRDQLGNMIGGDRAVFANVEYLFPLLDQLKLNGVAFFDVGNAWNALDSPLMSTVKAGAGLGVRWVSPMGPIRIEYGWKLTREKGQEAGAFAFAMGQLF
jgi:outer membrane protein insertion porin family